MPHTTANITINVHWGQSTIFTTAEFLIWWFQLAIWNWAYTDHTHKDTKT